MHFLHSTLANECLKFEHVTPNRWLKTTKKCPALVEAIRWLLYLESVGMVLAMREDWSAHAHQ